MKKLLATIVLLFLANSSLAEEIGEREVIILGELRDSKISAFSDAKTHNSSTKFTSIYTDLKKDCRDKFSDADDEHDMPVICKGPGGYRIDVEFSACCEHMQVENRKDFLLLFPQQRFSTFTKRKMEWRLANGKPFAIIYRIDKYKGDISYLPEKIGEVLIVKGLQGFANIDQEV